jgi:hypothetical protein
MASDLRVIEVYSPVGSESMGLYVDMDAVRRHFPESGDESGDGKTVWRDAGEGWEATDPDSPEYGVVYVAYWVTVQS